MSVEYLDDGIDSRFTEILEATINGEPYTYMPQSRMEALLLELKEVIEAGGGGGGGTSTIAWKPTVAADGTISWTRTASETKPADQNIKGPKGDDGAKGDKGDKGDKGNTGANGEDGDDGVGITNIAFKETDSSGNNVYTITLSDESTYDIVCPKGPQGPSGSETIDDTTISTGTTWSSKKVSDELATKVTAVSGKDLSTNDYNNTDKGKVDALGTASSKNVPTSGNAGSSEVVMGNDTRLTDSRSASDVYSWAKAENKPSYTASEVGAIPSTEKGANNGVAQLDATGKVPSSQLPSYVDDVVEYASRNLFPSTGETGKIYVAADTNLTYRWSGVDYVEISSSLALGETSSTAYAGDKGKAVADAVTAIKDGSTIDSFGDVETALGNKANSTKAFLTDDTAETDLADGDYFPFFDVSVNNNAGAKRKTLWSNIKAKLKTYFDTIYGSLDFTPTPDATRTDAQIASAINAPQDGSNTNVVSAYSVQRWSNEQVKTFLLKGTANNSPIGETGVGEWQDNLTSPTELQEQGWGWWYISEFDQRVTGVDIGVDDSVEIYPIFDPGESGEVIVLGGYIIDTSTGYCCIKFGNTITDTENVAVGFTVIRKRNEVSVLPLQPTP